MPPTGRYSSALCNGRAELPMILGGHDWSVWHRGPSVAVGSRRRHPVSAPSRQASTPPARGHDGGECSRRRCQLRNPQIVSTTSSCGRTADEGGCVA